MSYELKIYMRVFTKIDTDMRGRQYSRTTEHNGRRVSVFAPGVARGLRLCRLAKEVIRREIIEKRDAQWRAAIGQRDGAERRGREG